MRAVFPGSFDPLTVAHLAVVEAVRDQRGAVRVDLAISREALTKEGQAAAPIAERVSTIESLRSERPWIDVVVTDAQLLVDIAEGYDLLVVGADKWHQLHDPRFYGDSESARDDVVARLPPLAVVPRADIEVPIDDAELLWIPERHRHVSSSAVRRGRREWRA